MHINLILDNEQRSASPVSLAMVIRIAIGTVTTAVILWVISMYVSYRELQNSARYCSNEWAQTEPKHLAAKQLREDLIQKSAKLKEIQGWRSTRIEWGKQLENIRGIIPPVIQLTEIRLGQDILVTSNNIPARVFELRLSGKTGSAGSEANVGRLQEALFKQPPFDTFVESATIPSGAFRQDPINKADRIFEIVCKYNPRSFE